MCSSPEHHKGVAGLTVIAVCATVARGWGGEGQLAALAASSVATALDVLRDEFSIDP